MSSKKQPSCDDRFTKITKDPRFWEIPDVEKKVRIDKRFQSMFHDERFKLKYTVDKRGRPVSHTSTEDLKRFYKVSDSEQSDGGEEEQEEKEKEKEKKKKTKGKKGVEEEQEAQKEKEEEPAPKKTVKKSKKAESEKTGKTTSSSELLKGVRVIEEEEEEEDSEEEEDDDEDSEDESDSGPDLARGKGNVETSSEDEEEEEKDEVEDYLRREEEEIEHNWGEMWKDAPRTEEMSRRLAVCNMDWDRIKAKDLLALFSSFKPKDGVVLSVTIYPSEFGKERMKAEETQGPLELTNLPDDPEADTEDQIYREKVRDYQFKRLRYYYAVVECDSVETAAKIYEECDGFEYESSCSMVDLFIPDDVTFEDEPRDKAVEVDLSTYQPKLFTSATTTTAKVELTWDETDHDRVTALNKKFNKDELLDMDFNAYLASSSEDEAEEEKVKPEESVKEEKKEGKKGKKKKKKEEDQIAKYRELLQGIQEKDKKKDQDMEMEITWVPLKATAEKLVKKKLEGKDKLTPWEEFLEKKKEKKKEKRKEKKEVAISDDELPADVDLDDPFFAEEAEMALLMDDGDEEKHQHFNYDKIVEQQNLSKKKRKKLLKSNTLLEEDKFQQVDVQDPRFQAMFTSHLYNLDPSDPAYKKTKATQSILEEKQKRREQQEEHGQKGALKRQKTAEKPNKNSVEQENTTSTTPSTSGGGGDPASSQKKEMDPSLSMLIKSIKNKTEQFQARKKQRIK
uniref:ESF1, nucleolar pre-rRNA processing protein, homolog (S. cerevisiae) n=1 Tax=Astyanax mexicanus TaxID=7994 RepID=A0A3B1JLX5_ASTMX